MRFCNRTISILLVLLCLGSSLVASNVKWTNKTLILDAKPTDQVMEAAFQFEVVGEEFFIDSIKSSCGCTTTSLERNRYKKGETGEIGIRFEIGSRVGLQKKFVIIETKDPNEPSIELELRVFIPFVVRLDPRFVYWTKGSDRFQKQKIGLHIDVDNSVEIVSITSDQPQLELDWAPVKEDGKEYQIELQPVIPEGEVPFFRAVIKIEIDAEIELKQKVFYVYAFLKS